MIRPIQDLYNQYKDDICVVVPFGGMNHISNGQSIMLFIDMMVEL